MKNNNEKLRNQLVLGSSRGKLRLTIVKMAYFKDHMHEMLNRSQRGSRFSERILSPEQNFASNKTENRGFLSDTN